MFTRIVEDRRIVAERHGAAPRSAGDNRARHARRRNAGSEVRGNRFLRAVSQDRPLFRAGYEGGMCNLRILDRENSLAQILRGLAGLVPRMQRNDAERAAVANPYGRRRPVIHRPAKTKASGRPHPPVKRRENPSAIVLRQPAPRRRTYKRIAKKRILVPTAVTEGRPAEAHAERPPAVTIAAHRKPRTVCVEITKARRIVRRIYVLRGIVRGGHHAVNAPGNP